MGRCSSADVSGFPLNFTIEPRITVSPGAVDSTRHFGSGWFGKMKYFADGVVAVTIYRALPMFHVFYISSCILGIEILCSGWEVLFQFC